MGRVPFFSASAATGPFVHFLAGPGSLSPHDHQPAAPGVPIQTNTDTDFDDPGSAPDPA